MKIKSLMTREVYSCGPGDRGADAARIMWERDVGCVPIVDDQTRPIGMVTDRDLCMAAYTSGLPLWQNQVASVMSRVVFSCREDDSVADAERLMKSHQVRRLPVIDHQGVLVGILSLNDIVLARTRTAAAKLTEHMLGDVTATMAAICQPRVDGSSQLTAH